MLGEQLLIRMWETLTKEGIGSLASPWQIKREGKAHIDVRRHETLVMAQAEQDAEAIRSGAKLLNQDGKLISNLDSNHSIESQTLLQRIEPSIGIVEIGQLASQKEAARLAQEEINTNRTLIFAEEELQKQEKQPSEDRVKADWLNRWHENAKKTKTEELQMLWARTLAGEIASPGSYSLRTLDFLKNLTQKEALEISKLSPFVVGDFILKNPHLEKAEITFSILLEMEDIGILSGIKGNGLSATYSNESTTPLELWFTGKSISINAIATDKNTKSLTLNAYKVTTIGKEVLSLGDFKTDKNYMRHLGQEIKTKGFSVQLFEWISLDDGTELFGATESI